MNEALVKNLVDQQTELISGIIHEVRAVISHLETIESILEDNPITFRPLLKLAQEAFKKLLASGQLDDRRATTILGDLDNLEEEIYDFERSVATLRHVHSAA